MRYRNAIFDLAIFLAAIQWAFALGALVYTKLGIIGAIIALLVSPALFPFSPIAAWLFMSNIDMAWFYGFLGFALLSVVISSFTRIRISDESGREF